MPYLIDGHNLIPKIPALSLGAMDDELQLIQMVQEFCLRRNKRAEIFFDNSPPGQPRVLNQGLVLARFVRAGKSADEAIHARLVRLDKTARNWSVVSSDRQVQASARSARAQVIPSETFAQMLMQTLNAPPKEALKTTEQPISPDEIEDWLNLFQTDRTDE